MIDHTPHLAFQAPLDIEPLLPFQKSFKSTPIPWKSKTPIPVPSCDT